MWFKLRIVYKNAEKRNVIMGVFKAEDEVKEKLRNDELKQYLMEQMMGGESAYLINPETDKFKTIYKIVVL